MASANETTSPPLRIFIFDSTRLRSHLFFRFLSTHDALAPVYHPFLPGAMFGPERIVQHLKLSDARQRELNERRRGPGSDATYDTDRKKFVQATAAAESDGKVPIANEHWFNVLTKEHYLKLLRDPSYQASGLGGNPTHIPDDMFKALTPIILIRHPALSINSIYRTTLAVNMQRPGEEDFDLIAMNRPVRVLFDYFTAQGRPPIVVDGEDLLWRTDEIAKGICASLPQNLDPSGFSDTWTPTTKEEIEKMNPLVYQLTKDMHDSDGIRRPAEKVSSLRCILRDFT